MRVRDGMKLAIGFIMVNAIIGGVAAVVSELAIRAMGRVVEQEATEEAAKAANGETE